MSDLLAAVLAGLVAGVIASGVTSLYQAVTASLFGQGKSDEDPANVKAADDLSEAIEGRPVKASKRAAAGDAVHYATGAALGAMYGILVLYWPAAAIGFGVAFGIVVALVLDGLLVPAFGWGPWPWKTDAATHAYGISSHMVFGAALEGVRRVAVGLLT